MSRFPTLQTLLSCLLIPLLADADQPVRLDQGIDWEYCNPLTPANALPLPAPPLPSGQIRIEAERMDFDQKTGQGRLSGSVQLWRHDGYAEADNIIYHQDTRAADLFGNLFLQQSGLRIGASRGHLELDDDRGWLSDTEFRFTQRSARGSAETIELSGKQRSRFQAVIYTTCPPGKNDWSLAAAELDIDMTEGWGSARHARLRLAGVPLLYLPYFTFPVDERRKSGLLIPAIASSNRLGSELSLPYYFNIAPNYDATLTPRWMSRRGLMLGGEFRFLSDNHRGEISGEILHNDRQESPDHGDQRRALRFFHVSRPAPGLTTRIETNAVSDDEYLDDFGTGLAITSTRHLERVGEVSYRSGDWRMLGRLQTFQTVDETLSKRSHPYRRLPQLLGTYRSSDNRFSLDLAFIGEYTDFKHDTLNDGERLILRPSLSLPMRRSWGHLTPRLSLNYAAYKLDEKDAPVNEKPHYFVPAFSLDSGLVFERDTHWFGASALQTLEPRLFYLYAPYEDQSEIPDFDTADLDLRLANLFKENRFTGKDRFGDANQISFGLTSRWFQASNGMERLRAGIGQIYYAKKRAVQLTEPVDENPSSAVVAELSTRLGRYWRSTLNLRRNPHLEEDQIDKGRFTLRYHTPDREQFNIDYNFNRDTIEDLDISFFWPFGHKFSLFGKWKHSYLYERNMNRILGFEYGGRCCWKLRTLFQRYVANEDRDEDEASRFMLQLELRGLGALGQPVEKTMQDTIYGYQTERQ
ncbi:MAG: LPS assembly protein LptD [Candidatus Thiodiazotropha sp. (ex Dulcina madagascariensis)]|nr:LPS assembly protein LptD [Candidatus Thiodiazotropha sp. (ex Dulcina madagascariensis)]MCU7926230.1 LPS assembly protein LptD [Candidatus Thiodiazotropha sp. (ex Dulcina madagascariensis)]